MKLFRLLLAFSVGVFRECRDPLVRKVLPADKKPEAPPIVNKHDGFYVDELIHRSVILQHIETDNAFPKLAEPPSSGVSSEAVDNARGMLYSDSLVRQRESEYRRLVQRRRPE